ncbi:MAG: AraC family transcriptional regulator [Desulfamplus sp.]|nr:AraC family transcriptional regulator [Desulfamplus sp.]
MYITKGKGRHYIDFKPYEYSQGSILFISCGQVHAFDVNLETDGFVLLFTEKFLTKNLIHSDTLTLSRFYNYHLYPPDIPPLPTSIPVFNPIINEIYNEFIFVDTFAKEEMLRTLLKLLLLKAERIKRTLAPKEKNSEWIIKFSEFRKLLSKHFTETRNAEDYANMMTISYNHLNKITKSTTGSTAKAFIDNFIILEIKRQLAISDISVKELTYLMGFDEPTNFAKYFKKHTLYSPAQFRNTLKN